MPIDNEHRERLFRQGMITDTQYRRAGGVCGPDEIDDEEYQGDAGPGFGKADDWGPDDAGHIDAKANGRGDRESRMGKRPPSARTPTVAEAKASLADQWDPGWFDITGPSRN
jgi:hypothetical protein